MFTALANCLASGLSIAEFKEKHKYIDKLIALEKAYHEEYIKPLTHRSDAVLDNLEWELRLLSTAFGAAIRVKDAKA